MAAVEIHVDSFNGSYFGRYPHTFIVLEGTLEGDGRKVRENYGFSAKSSTAAFTQDWAAHAVYVEQDKYIGKTNRHFSVTLTDAQLHPLRGRDVDNLGTKGDLSQRYAAPPQEMAQPHVITKPQVGRTGYWIKCTSTPDRIENSSNIHGLNSTIASDIEKSI